MKTLKEQREIYDRFHTNKTDQLTHYIGIPAIVFSLLMLLNWVSIDIAAQWKISFAWLVVIAALIYYCMLNVRIGILTTIVLVILTFIAALVARPTPTQLSALLFLVLFIGGWALIFIGHSFEKNKLGFNKILLNTIHGPIFLVMDIINLSGIGQLFEMSKKKEEKKEE